jgi:NAD(P)H-dependent FMN reductase
MKVFLFAASLRHGSYNKKLIREANEILKSFPDCEPELCEFNEFPMPMYDGDIEESQGIPEGVMKLAQKISTADAIVISSPEYNGSIPGTFKNAIDWLSRISPVPLEGKQICLIGASPGSLGGVRGNIHSRVPLHVLKTHVWPDYLGVAKAHEAFDAEGKLKDANLRKRLETMLLEFLHFASRTETPFDRLNEFFEEQKKASHPQ